MVELLAPVGNWTMLRAAVKAGADAVYFGVKGFNMRASSINFDIDEIKEVIDYCHQNNVKAYCTVNIIILEQEIEKLHTILQTLQDSNIDAVICWDFAVIQKCKELHIPIHLSTQASVSNSQSALQWKEFGVERIVLARECSLEDVKDIKEKTNMEIEVFVHGARCISLSGRCFMSQELFGKSANKGECLQPCRREYTVTDEEGKQMVMDNNFIMSAKDLCALPLLP
ncbi:U32 family peptidase, partial [Candidatus Woesearchaeota archaeon]|nr:U32 family peptidase [Candidatus Woesearchaeota archaeon]